MSEQIFETLSEAISFVFKHEQTSLLSLDRICEVLNLPELFISSKKSGIVSCSTISRRRISSTLSSSELFIRAGAPRACLWAIQPHNPLFLTDGQISSSIDQMLTTHGPLTLHQFVTMTDLVGVDNSLIERFLSDHSTEYTMAPDGTYWYAGQTRPTKMDFDNINSALIYAFKNFPKGASVEELHWFLCLSTVAHTKPITRRSVSRELSRKPELFLHLARAKYTLNTIKPEPRSLPPPTRPPLPQISVPLFKPPSTFYHKPPLPQPLLNSNTPTVFENPAFIPPQSLYEIQANHSMNFEHEPDMGSSQIFEATKTSPEEEPFDPDAFFADNNFNF